MIAEIRFNRERLAAAAEDEMLAATDLADALVKEGVPFREAHDLVGGMVRAAVDSGKPLSELTDSESTVSRRAQARRCDVRSNRVRRSSRRSRWGAPPPARCLSNSSERATRSQR